MKQLFAALLVASFAVAASAQTAPAAAPAPSAAAPAKAHPCIDDAKAKGLKGEEAKKAIAQCRADHKAKKTSCQDQTKDVKGKAHAAAMKECMAK
jgi:hypothetical protein